MNIFIFLPFLTLCAVASSQLSDYTAASTEFSFEFFKRAYNPTENAILSPISIHSSLSMFYDLAGDVVSPDMQQHLNLPADKAAAASNLRHFLSTVSTSEALKMRSKIYHADAPLNPALLPLFRDQFGAEVEAADFHQVDDVVASVNNWVNEATGGLISEFMEAADLRVDNDLMLLNVVALNASWKEAFDPSETETTQFHFVNGNHDVELMHQDFEIPFAMLPDYDCYAIELFYEDETDLSMVVILPMRKTTLKNVVQKLNLDFYRKLDGSLHTMRVTIAIPKFTLKKKLDAKELLKEMGLKSMFDKLDLNILTRDKSRVGEVRQSSYIKVHERGTEAAAATEIQTVGRSGYPSFYANRPFLYLIRKRSTKDIIFIGHFSVYEQ